jgi:hypothetical protein
MLFRETLAVYCENHTEHANAFVGRMMKKVVHIVTTGLSRVNFLDYRKA